MSFDAYIEEYPGDAAWRSFTEAVGSADDEIANVAGIMLGEESQRWLGQGIPALRGLSPQFLIESHPQGQTIVRSLLMRLP